MATIDNFQNDKEKKEKEEQTLFILLELILKYQKIYSFSICCNSLLQVTGSQVQNGTGHIHVMRKDRYKHCVTVLEEWSRGENKTILPKTIWERMIEDERHTAGWKSWASVLATLTGKIGQL